MGKQDNDSQHHGGASFLKQQLSITVYGLPTRKTNFRFPFPFAANKQKFAVFPHSFCSKPSQVAVFR
jgi:hypothetical protein